MLGAVGLENVSLSNPCTLEDFIGLSDHQYLTTHHPPGLNIYNAIELGNIKVIFHFRDPRDVAVSTLDFVHWDSKKAPFYKVEFLKKVYANCFASKDELLEAIIRSEKHIPYIYDLDSQFRLNRGLLFHPNVLKTRFEDLVGERGGGNHEAQIETIQRILDFLEINANADQIAGKVFDVDSKTFHKGRIGRWKDVFKPHHVSLFDRLYGDVLRDYGYVVGEPKLSEK